MAPETKQGTDQITVTLEFDRRRLEEIARRFAMLRVEPSIPISTKDLRQALDAPSPSPESQVDGEGS